MDIDALRERRWILLPGTLCTSGIFEDFLDLVGVESDRRFPVVLKHLQIDDYISVLDQVMRPGAVVCGFSLGAIVAAHLADRLDASALVLFGLNPLSDDPDKARDRQIFAQAVKTEGGRAALQPRLPAIYGKTPARTTELLLTMADDTADLIEEQTALALNRPGAMGALAAARCPVRLLTGSEDKNAPFALAQAAAKVAADGLASELDGLGHYALAEDARLCHAALSGQSVQ